MTECERASKVAAQCENDEFATEVRKCESVMLRGSADLAIVSTMTLSGTGLTDEHHLFKDRAVGLGSLESGNKLVFGMKTTMCVM